MTSIAQKVIAIVLIVLSFSCSPESLSEETETLSSDQLVVPETKPMESEILQLINAYREEQGLKTLRSLEIVKSAAFTHTDFMVESQSVSHANFFVRSNYLKDNTGAVDVSENVAYGFTTAKSVVDAWMRSEAHRKNIVGDFTFFDISAEQDTDGKWYFTNMFIKK